jgi:hypothetical protein
MHLKIEGEERERERHTFEKLDLYDFFLKITVLIQFPADFPIAGNLDHVK